MGTAIGIGVSPSLTSMLGAGSDPILPSGLWLDPDTWTRTGGRFSIGPDLSLDANEGDVFCMDGRDVNGIMKAATSISPDQIDQYDTFTGTSAPPGKFLIEDSSIGNHRAGYVLSKTALGVAINIKVRRGSGTRNLICYKDFQLNTERFNVDLGDGSVYGVLGSPVVTTELIDGWWHIHALLPSTANFFTYIGMDDGGGDGGYTGNGTSSLEFDRIALVTGSDIPAFFPEDSAASTSYGDDLATVTAPAWPATGRTLTVSRRNYTTGVISSVSTTPAPIAGNYVLDGSTDGNYTYLSRVSNNILTAGQIADQEAVMETILAATPEFCPNWVLVDSEPVYVNGIPIEVV